MLKRLLHYLTDEDDDEHQRALEEQWMSGMTGQEEAAGDSSESSPPSALPSLHYADLGTRLRWRWPLCDPSERSLRRILRSFLAAVLLSNSTILEKVSITAPLQLVSSSEMLTTTRRCLGCKWLSF